MRRNGSGILVVFSAVLVAGCGAGDDNGEGGALLTVADSSGVEIVVNRVPPTGLPVYATLDSAPNLSLGFVRGDETSYLWDVRGAVTLSQGITAVAEARTFQIRFYLPDGSWLGWMGSEGLDPGEYFDLSRLGRAGGDTLWAADYVRNRLTVFGREEDVVGVHELPSDYSVSGRFGDGSYLLVPRWTVALHRDNPVDGVRRDPARYLRWWPEGDTTTVGTFPHDQMLAVDGTSGLSAGVPPFGRRTVQAVGPGRFYVGDQEGFVIGGYDPDGTPRQSIRLEGLELALTPEQVAEAKAAGAPSRMDPEVVDQFWATLPETRPAYGRVLLDGAGNLWVSEHVATNDPPRNWIVFGPDGVVRGTATMPRYFSPREIGVDYILGVLRSVGGDQRVVRFGMKRNG